MKEFICRDCCEPFQSDSDTPDCPSCKDNNVEEISPCCGGVVGDDRICPDCHEHC